MSRELIKAELDKEENKSFLPNMNPDLFDDFITYLYERVDLRSFASSTIQYKLSMRKKFLRSLDPEKLQYALSFI